MVNDKDYRRRRRIFFFHTTSASLPEAQLIAYYLREPPGSGNPAQGKSLRSTSPVHETFILPPRASPEILLKVNPCWVHESGPQNFSLEKLEGKSHLV